MFPQEITAHLQAIDIIVRHLLMMRVDSDLARLDHLRAEIVSRVEAFDPPTPETAQTKALIIEYVNKIVR